MGKNISLTIETTDAIIAQFESFVTSHGLKPGEALEILLESYGEGAEEPNEEDLEAIGRGLAEAKTGRGTPLEDFIAERRLERATRRAEYEQRQAA